MTIYDDSTILKYSNGTGPGPGPAEKFFTQSQCVNDKCTEFCRNGSFPIGMCLQVSGGGSAVATQCNSQGLVQKFYNESTGCSGPSVSHTMPVDQCLKGETGNYFENICDTTVPQKRIPGKRPSLQRQ
jgi:hypothetical protein